MRIFVLLVFLYCGNHSKGQTFLDSYRSLQIKKIKSDNRLDSLRKTENGKKLHLTRKIIKRNKLRRIWLLQSQINQFDTVFKSYFARKGFDFNTSDSFTLVYQTSVENNLSDYIFWSGKDTISYGEFWFVASLHSTQKRIRYKPFLDTTQRASGMRLVTERDSLMTLATKGDFKTAERLSKENPVLDGVTTTILFVKKAKGEYSITEYRLQSFGFVPILRRE